MADIQRKSIMRLDADETVFFKRQLEYVKTQTYDEVYKDLKAFMVLPISMEAPMGATEITWRSYKQYGMARIIADYAHDFPRVDLFGVENTVKIKDIGDSYGYSIPEIRRAAQAGFALEQRRAAAARKAMDQRINTIGLTGDTTHNIQGFIDYPGITEYVTPVGAAGSARWAQKTPDEIITDLSGIITAIMASTSGKERPNMILLPMTQYNLIRNTRMTGGSDKTIYTFFRENNPDVEIDWLIELADAGDADSDEAETDRMIAYEKNPMKLTFEIPTGFEQMEEQHEGMEYRIPCHASTAGVIIYYPLSVAYADSI